MINIGIIGAGTHGWDHCMGFDKLDDAQVVAVADPNEKNIETSKSAIQRSSPSFMADYEDLLQMSEVQAVVIATPTYLHSRIAIDALKAKKDILLEKPIAPTIKETDKIIIEHGKTDQIIQVGLEYRYSNLYRTMAHLVEDGIFGNIMMTYCKEYRDNFPSPWFFDENKSGGALLDKNVHHFDIFNWLAKSPPKRVYAMGGQHVVKSGHKIDCIYSLYQGKVLKNPNIVDHANVLIEYENGAKANLSLCMYESQPIKGLEIGIIGDNGIWASTKEDENLITNGHPPGKVNEIDVDYYSDNEGLVHIGVQAERRSFIECIKKREQPYANLLIGRQACLIAFAAEKSIKKECAVEIAEYKNPNVEKIFQKKGYESISKTPPTFSLPDSQVIPKKKQFLRSKKRELKKKLKKIEKKINELSE